jgi:hypothetical protein
MKIRKKIVFMGVLIVGLSLSSQVFARSSQEEMQQRLNEEVLSKQFNVADDSTLSKSLDEATERGKPTKSEKKNNYYRYWYNGYYYPHPYSWYRYYGYW